MHLTTDNSSNNVNNESLLKFAVGIWKQYHFPLKVYKRGTLPLYQKWYTKGKGLELGEEPPRFT